MRTPTVLAAVLAIGCSHGAYRRAVTLGGVAAQFVDTRQTVGALGRGDAEANPLYMSDHPSPALLMGGAALGMVGMVGWSRFVEWLPDRGPETKWVKDIMATIPMITEGYCVWHNTGIIGTDPRRW